LLPVPHSGECGYELSAGLAGFTVYSAPGRPKDG